MEKIIGQFFIFRAAGRYGPVLFSTLAGVAILALTPLSAQELDNSEEAKIEQESESAESIESGFGEGRFLVELRRTYGLDFGGSIAKSFRDQHRTPAFGPLSVISGDPTTLAISYLVRSDAPEAELESRAAALSFEYGILDWLGAGLTVNHASYNLKNANLFPTSFALSLVPIPGFALDPVLLNAELASPLITGKVTDFDRITSADLNLALHPFGGGGVLDPYLRVIGGYGRTKVNDLEVLRYGGALGLRIFITDSFYVVTEVALVNNRISSTEEIYPYTGDLTGTLRETNAQVGLGFAF